jgi:hypothetical protein
MGLANEAYKKFDFALMLGSVYISSRKSLLLFQQSSGDESTALYGIVETRWDEKAIYTLAHVRTPSNARRSWLLIRLMLFTRAFRGGPVFPVRSTTPARH